MWLKVPSAMLRILARFALVGALVKGSFQGGIDDRSSELFKPPTAAEDLPHWLTQLETWREVTRKNISYTGEVYDDPQVNWTRTSFAQPQTHLFDLSLYDPELHKFTVDRYLDDVTTRYGGIDSVLIWPTYPNIGIDARNQFDYFRAMPGGMSGIKQLTSDFKRHGVRVLWGYNPWDQGTTPEPQGEPHWTTLARLLKDTDGDGFNGDTMVFMWKQFWDAGINISHHIVGEMEIGGYARKPDPKGIIDTSWNYANWELAGWGYWTDAQDSYAMGIDKLKWLDGRRMTHVCNRWGLSRGVNDTPVIDRISDMQMAFFNGVGYETWENVWGMFNYFTPRDGEAMKRISTMGRWLLKQEFTQGFATWEPYTQDLRMDTASLLKERLFASKFVHASGDCAWLMVNRDLLAKKRATLNVSACHASQAGQRYYDLYHGKELTPKAGIVTIAMDPHDFGAVIATSRELPLQELLRIMEERTKIPLVDVESPPWKPLSQHMVGMEGLKGAWWDHTPVGMVMVPQTKYRFRTAGVEIEGGCDLARDTWGVCCTNETTPVHCPDDPRCPEHGGCANTLPDIFGVDVQFPWEATPNRFHERHLEVGPFYIDKHLVTKAEYAQFLSDSHYKPRDHHNFLVGWILEENTTGMYAPPQGEEQQPVVWVSLNEARKYCAWAGKRLPHVYEWQLAAQGSDGRLFPWGNESAEGVRFPKTSNGTRVPPLPDIGSFSPAGDSVFGMADVVGHVWQYTDEFRDAHTRGVVLKGSSLYTPMLSADFPSLNIEPGNWYFPKAQQVDRHNRLLLMDDSYERAGTLGFRCVADHVDGQIAPFHFKDLDAPVENVNVDFVI